MLFSNAVYAVARAMEAAPNYPINIEHITSKFCLLLQAYQASEH